MMKIPMHAVAISSSIVTSAALAMLQDSVNTLIPWLMAITMVVVADLAAGVRKSLKLGIHVSISMAGRETLGKLLTYSAVTLMFAMVDAASGHDLEIAKWGCLLIFFLEGVSIIGNILKPMGVSLSLQNVLKIFAQRAAGLTEGEADSVVTEEQVNRVRQQERVRWEHRATHQYGAEKRKDKKK